MRGHAKGPFNNVSAAHALPVLRVQRQIKLTPGVSESVQIEATPTAPVVLRIQANVTVALATGTNGLVVGTSGTPNLYLATGDTTLGTVGFNTEKRFLLTAAVTLIASLASAGTSATGALTIAAITAANTQTVTIGAQTYTFNTALTNTANNVLIGADVTAMAANLAAAINAGTGAGTTYGTGTVANTSVTATSTIGVITITAKTVGTAANATPTTETLTNGSFGAATLTGGVLADTAGAVWVFLDA